MKKTIILLTKSLWNTTIIGILMIISFLSFNALQVKAQYDEFIWVDDFVPPCPTEGGTFNWITSNPAPYSGTRALKSDVIAGLTQQERYFHTIHTSQRITTTQTDSLFAWAYFDAAAVNWDANSLNTNWTGWNDISSHTVSSGVLNLTFSGGDPYLYSPTISVSATTYKSVRVRMKNNGSGTEARLYWNNGSGINETYAQNVSVISSDGDYTDYVWVLTNNANWSGTITQLRFDPIHTGAANGQTVNIVFIEISNCPKAIQLQFGDNGGGWDHRAFWGYDEANYLNGTGENSNAKRKISHMLPLCGTWTKLKFKADDIIDATTTWWGLSYQQSGGLVTWDKVGYIKSDRTGAGLTADFYDSYNTDATETFMGTRTYANWATNCNWWNTGGGADSSPDDVSGTDCSKLGMGTDNWGIMLSGYYKAPSTGTYSFRVSHDDGARIYMMDNDQATGSPWAYNDWTASGCRNSGTQTPQSLTGGKFYAITVEFYNAGGGSCFHGLQYSTGGGTWNDIPVGSLFTYSYPATANGLKADYYANANLSGTPSARNWIEATNLNSSRGTISAAFLAGNNTTDNFSYRWSGYLKPNCTGSYTFCTKSDDQNSLILNGTTVVNDWPGSSSTWDWYLPGNNNNTFDAYPTDGMVFNLTAGQYYPITATFGDLVGDATHIIYWESSTCSATGAGSIARTTPVDFAVLYTNNAPQVQADAGPAQSTSGGTITIGGMPTASNGTSPYVYAWAASSGATPSAVANPTIAPTVNTTYTVTVTDANSFTATSSVAITKCTGTTITAQAAGGNWSATGTWVGGVVPGSCDNVIINSGTTVNIDGTNRNCMDLTLNGTLASAGFGLTVAGNASGTTGGLNPTSGSPYITFSGINKSLSGTYSLVTTALTWTVNFTGNHSVANAGSFTLQNSIAGTMTMTISGYITNNGTLTLGSAATGTRNLTINTTGKLINGATGTLNIGAALTNRGVLDATTSGNTVVYTSTSGNQTIPFAPSTYHHLTINKTGRIATLAGAVTINGNLTISVGTLADAGYTITLKGNVTNNGTYSGSGKLYLNGGSAQHTINTTSSSGNNTYYKIEVDDTYGANAISLGTAAARTTTITNLTLTTGNFYVGDFKYGSINNRLTITNAITIPSGFTFGFNNTVTSSNPITFSGDVTINSGGIWSITSSSSTNNITFSGNVTNNGTWTDASSSAYTLAGTKSYTGYNTIYMPTIKVSNYNPTFKGLIYCSTNFNTSSLQAFTMDNTYAYNGGTGTLITIAGLSSSAGWPYLQGGGANTKIKMTGSQNQYIGNCQLTSLEIDKTGGIAKLSNTTSTGYINNGITVTNGTFDFGIYVPDASNVPITVLNSSQVIVKREGNSAFKTPSWSTNSTFTCDSLCNQLGANTFGNVILQGSTKTVTLQGSAIVNNQLTVNTGVTFADNTNTITVKGNVANSGTHSGAGKIYLNGGSASHTITGTNGAFAKLELNDANGASLSSGNTITVADLPITSGTFTNNGTLTVSTSITGSGTLTNATNSSLTYGGTGAIAPALTASANPNTVTYTNSATVKSTTYHHFIMNGSGKTATFGGAVTINGDLTITAGTLDVSSSNYNLNLTGNFVNNSTLNPRAGTVYFIGNTLLSGSNNTTLFKAEINAGKFLTVASGRTLTMDSTLYIRALDPHNMGQLVMTDNTSYLSGGSNNKRVYVEAYDTLNNWHYISSPIYNGYKGAMINLVGFYGKRYNEPTQTWIAIVGTDSLRTGIGYAIKYSVYAPSRLITFKEQISKLHNGTISVNTTNTAGGGVGGWNLVGNPYPSAIDWQAANGWNNTNVDPTIYLYDAVQSRYATFNKITEVSTNGGTRYIPPVQGLYIHCNSSGGTFSMDNRVRVAYNQPFWKGTGNINQLNSAFSLKVSGNGYSDESVIGFNTEATSSFDKDYDAYKLLSPEENVPQINTTTLDGNNVKVAVNFLPQEYSQKSTVPLQFTVGQAGTYTISANNASFDPSVMVTLEDLKTGKMTDLQSASYTFTSETVTNESRFLIHFGGVVPTSVKEKELNELVTIYTDRNNIVIRNTSNVNEKGLITIYDMLGKEVSSRELTPNSLTSIEMNDKAQSVYFVRIMTDNKSLTKKVCITR